MEISTPKTTQLGELVVAVFDEAEHYSDDPRTVSQLATLVVTGILRRARWTADQLGRLPPIGGC